MFEKEAKKRARDFTDNEGRQVAYECGFLDGADRATEELKEDNKVMSNNYSKMEQKFYDNLSKAKAIIKDLMNNSDEYARQRALDFLKKGENKK